jgi:hypothetical protein
VHARPTLDVLDHRMSVLERRFEGLTDLVDGTHERSHRTRLHVLENDDRSARLAAEALQAYREQRDQRGDRRSTRVREWASFVLAAVAITLSVLSAHPWS